MKKSLFFFIRHRNNEILCLKGNAINLKKKRNGINLIEEKFNEIDRIYNLISI